MGGGGARGPATPPPRSVGTSRSASSERHEQAGGTETGALRRQIGSTRTADAALNPPSVDLPPACLPTLAASGRNPSRLAGKERATRGLPGSRTTKQTDASGGPARDGIGTYRRAINSSQHPGQGGPDGGARLPGRRHTSSRGTSKARRWAMLNSIGSTRAAKYRVPARQRRPAARRASADAQRALGLIGSAGGVKDQSRRLASRLLRGRACAVWGARTSTREPYDAIDARTSALVRFFENHLPRLSTAKDRAD